MVASDHPAVDPLVFAMIAEVDRLTAEKLRRDALDPVLAPLDDLTLALLSRNRPNAAVYVTHFGKSRLYCPRCAIAIKANLLATARQFNRPMRNARVIVRLAAEDDLSLPHATCFACHTHLIPTVGNDPITP